MNFQALDCGKIPATVHLSRFQGQGGAGEYHLIVQPTQPGGIETQLEWVSQAYRLALAAIGLDERTAMLRRFLCSDLPNQVAPLEARPFSNPRNRDVPCAVSWIGQPPAPPANVALWAYHVSNATGTRGHHWTTGIVSPGEDTTYQQTRSIFEKYDEWLRGRGMTLADNVIRTWLFVQDIDANYPEMVAARREFFAERGLTPATHFIASTGVEGRSADEAAKVTMDAYAIYGVRSEQIRFLVATDHLCPTYRYGVTFERATAVAYQDRKHVLISGTASIDPEGNILYPGDVSRQLDRTIENVEALLQRAGATLQDMGVFIVYVRDPADRDIAWQRMRERFGDAPIVVVTARVCRPGWLIEVEGEAIIPATNPGLPAF